MIDMLWVPLVKVISFLCKWVDRALFSWWYDSWQQRKANEALWRDIQAHFYYLVGDVEPGREKRPAILPFDYASVNIVFKNVKFCFTRGRGEFNVTLSPVRFPGHSYHLACVLAAFTGAQTFDARRISTLEDTGEALRARLDAINESFSEGEYAAFREKL